MAKRPSWRKRRHLYEELLDRDGPVCAFCGVFFEEGLPKRRMTIDHDVPLSRGGTSDFSNLKLACSICNSRKGSRTGPEYLNSDELKERVASIQGQMLAHNHASILFNSTGHWSCLCGAVGAGSDDPKKQACNLYTYGAFYRPTG